MIPIVGHKWFTTRAGRGEARLRGPEFRGKLHPSPPRPRQQANKARTIPVAPVPAELHYHAQEEIYYQAQNEIHYPMQEEIHYQWQAQGHSRPRLPRRRAKGRLRRKPQGEQKLQVLEWRHHDRLATRQSPRRRRTTATWTSRATVAGRLMTQGD